MCGHNTNKCTLVRAFVQKEKLKKKKTSKERKYTKLEVSILVENKMKKALKKREKLRVEELRAFENMSILYSDKKSSNVSSSKEGEV